MNDDQLLDFKQHGKIVMGTVHSASVLDALNVTEFGQETVDFVGKRRGIQLLLNFEHVGYLSSAVLTELLRIKEASEKNNGGLRLCAVSEDIRKVFEITNLDKVFVIYGDAQDALHKYERALEVEQQEQAWMGDDA